jgi:nitronate monooxygenase
MQTLDKLLNIKYPIILAPMFLVTNSEMLIVALNNGITAAIPAMNYRSPDDLSKAISKIKSETDLPFGINIIANRSNTKLEKQLDATLADPPAFIITSLGNPVKIIERAHKLGVKVFCDVTELKFATKVEQLGADALIAVNSSAGGHSGIYPKEEFLKKLIAECNIPVINAGGVANGKDLREILDLGAAGASIGTIFIASTECAVSDEYKNALIKFGEDDIVMTKKLSGAPTTVINTDYVKKIGTKPNFLEYLVVKNTFLKKIAKLIITRNGQSKLAEAAFKATYKTVWCASKSIEHIKEIRSLADIIRDLTD